MYEMQGQIRYSEVDAQGKLSIPALLNYFQDSCTFQSETLGVGLKYLMERQIGWVLTSWQICINRMPEMGEEVVTQTWPYAFRGIFGHRNFCMRDKNGEVLAYANSIWILMDLSTGKPMRVPEEIAGKYIDEPPLEMPNVGRKIPVPEAYELKEEIPVLRYFIDTNRHVNNEKYIMLAENLLPSDFSVGEIRVEYRNAAVLDDILYPRVTEEEDRIYVNLTDEAGKTYAVVLFIQGGNP
ncbi:MAG: acyl-[acyl-carrier-protein] thioesterase [Agathobacter sp.]|nr:acyl-[acyl-carrier-protein] thioesterase [Agathobacter sp.]